MPGAELSLSSTPECFLMKEAALTPARPPASCQEIRNWISLGERSLRENFMFSFSSPVDHPDEGVPLVEEGVEHVHVAGEGVLEAGLVLAEEHQRPGQLQEAEQDGEQGQVVTRPTHQSSVNH